MEQYVTLRLQLHHLSNIKKDLIEQAMQRYQDALSGLLELAREDAYAVCCEDRRAQQAFLKEFFQSGALEKVNEFSAQPFKDSIKRQFSAILTSWFTQRAHNPDTRYPRVKSPDKPARHLYFCRHSAKREYCLLYDRHTGRYYAKLHLLSRRDPAFPCPKVIEPQRFEMLGGEIALSASSPRYLLAPLSFGKRQLAILEEARQGRAEIKTANLLFYKGAYYLNVCIRLPQSEGAVPKNFLGISRALGSDLTDTVCDQEGNVLSYQALNLPDGKRTQSERLHIMANRIVALAKQWDAQVILARFSLCTDGIRYDNAKPSLSIAEYMQLSRILCYKLPQAGMPAPILVSPARLFCTCPNCQNVKQENRMFEDVFICTRCGLAVNTDELGSLNLAQRILRYRQSKLIFRKIIKVNRGYLFVNDAFQLSFFAECTDDFLHMLEEYAPEKPYDAKTASLLNKIHSVPDIREIVEIIES